MVAISTGSQGFWKTIESNGGRTCLVSWNDLPGLQVINWHHFDTILINWSFRKMRGIIFFHKKECCWWQRPMPRNLERAKRRSCKWASGWSFLKSVWYILKLLLQMHQLSVVMMGLLMFYIVGTFVFNPLYCFLHVSVPFYMRIPGCPRFLLQRNQGKPSLMPPSCPMNSPKRRWCLDRYKLDVAPSQLHMKVHGDSLIIFVITSGGDWH